MKHLHYMAFYLAMFAIGTALICFLYSQVLILTFLLIICSVIAYKFKHADGDIYYMVIGAVVGPVAEIFAISHGAWAYAFPSFLGIPLWLPFGWAVMSLLIRRITDTVNEMRK